MPPKKRKSVAVPTGPSAAEVEATCQTLSKELSTEEAILMDTLRRLKADIAHTAACVDAGEHEAAKARDAATRIDERLRASLLRSERLVQGAERYKALQTAAVVAADRTVDAIYDDLDALKARAAAAGASEESEEENENEITTEEVEAAAGTEGDGLVDDVARAETNGAAAVASETGATKAAPTTLGAALLLGGAREDDISQPNEKAGHAAANGQQKESEEKGDLEIVEKKKSVSSSSAGVGVAAATNKKKKTNSPAATSSPRPPPAQGSPFDSPRQQHRAAKDALFPPPIGADLPLSPTAAAAAARDDTVLHPEREGGGRGCNAQAEEEDRLAAANVRYGRYMRALFAARQRQADTLKALLVRLRTMAQSVALGADGGAHDSDTNNNNNNLCISKNNNQPHNNTNRDIPTTSSTSPSTITLGDVSVDASSNGGGIRGGDDVVVGGRLSDESFLYLPQQTWAVLRGLDRHLVDTVTANRMHHHRQHAAQSQPKLKMASLRTHQHESEPSPSSDTSPSLKGATFPSSLPPTAATATAVTGTDPSDLTQRWSQDVLLAASAAARASADAVTVTTTTTTTAAAVGAATAIPAAAATSSSSVSLFVVAPATPMLLLPPPAAATRAAVSNHNPQTNTAVHVPPELSTMLEEFLAPLSRSLSSAGGVSPMDFIASNRSPSSFSSSSCVQEARSAAVVACLPATAYQHAFNTETHGGHTSSSSSAPVALSALPSTMPTLPPWQQAADAAASSHASHTALCSAGSGGANGSGIPSACAVTVLSSVDEALGGVLAANIEAATAPPPPTTTTTDSHESRQDLLTASLHNEAAADAAATPSEHLSIVLVQGRVVPSTNTTRGAASGEDRDEDEDDDVWITVGDAEDRIGGDAGAGAELLLPPAADASGSGRSNATPPPPQRHRQRQPFAAKPISLRALVDMACRAPAEALLATLQGRRGGDEMTTTTTASTAASTSGRSRRHLLLVIEVTGHIPPGSMTSVATTTTTTRDRGEGAAAADNDGCVVVAGPLMATRFHYRHRCWPLDSVDSQTTNTSNGQRGNAISMRGVCVAAVGLRLAFRAANVGLLSLLPPPGCHTSPATGSPMSAARDHLDRFVDAILDPLTTTMTAPGDNAGENPLLPLLARRTYVPPRWAEHRGVTTKKDTSTEEVDLTTKTTTAVPAAGEWALRHPILVPSDACVHVSAFMTASSLLLSSKPQQHDEGDAAAATDETDMTADGVPLLATRRKQDEERQGRIHEAFNVFLKDRRFALGDNDSQSSSPSTTVATVLRAGIAPTAASVAGGGCGSGVGVGFAGAMRSAVVQRQRQHQQHHQEEVDVSATMTGGDTATAAPSGTAHRLSSKKGVIYFAIECASSPTATTATTREEKAEEEEEEEKEDKHDDPMMAGGHENEKNPKLHRCSHTHARVLFPLPYPRVLAQLAAEVQHYIRVNSGGSSGSAGSAGGDTHLCSAVQASSVHQPSLTTTRRFFHYEDYDVVVIDVQRIQIDEVEEEDATDVVMGGGIGSEDAGGVVIRTRVIAALVPSAVRRYASTDNTNNNTTITASPQLSSSAAACHRRSRSFFHLQRLQQQQQQKYQSTTTLMTTTVTTAGDTDSGYFSASPVRGGQQSGGSSEGSEGIRAFCRAFFENLQQEQQEQQQQQKGKSYSSSNATVLVPLTLAWQYEELVPVEALIHLRSSSSSSRRGGGGGNWQLPNRFLRVPSFALLGAPSLLSAEEKLSSFLTTASSSSGHKSKRDMSKRKKEKKNESEVNKGEIPPSDAAVPRLLLLKPRATVLPGGGVHRLGLRDLQYLAEPAYSSFSSSFGHNTSTNETHAHSTLSLQHQGNTTATTCTALCMLLLLPSVTVEPPGGGVTGGRSLAAEVQQAWRTAACAANNTTTPTSTTLQQSIVPLMTTVADLLQPEGGPEAGAATAESDAVRAVLKIAPDSVVQYLSTVAAGAHRAQSKASAVEGHGATSSLSSSIRILFFPLRASTSSSSLSGLITKEGSGGWVGLPSPPRPMMFLPAVGAPLAVVMRHAMAYYSAHQHNHSHNHNTPTTTLPTTATEAVEGATRLSKKVDAVSRCFTSIYL